MDYIEVLSNLRSNQKWGRKSPQKAVLMLAVIELYETDVLTENVIYYNDVLKNTYRKVWNKVLPNEQLFHDEAYLPYWNLQSDCFWHVVPKRGREDILSMMADDHIEPSEAKIEDCVNYVELDEDLYFLMTLPSGRSSLKRTLLENYTSLSKQAIKRFSQSVDNCIDYSVSALYEYEKILSQKKPEEITESAEADDHLVSQFRRLNEDVQITLNLQYYSFLKSHPNERELFKEICPSVYMLFDVIVGHPIKRTEISPTQAYIFDNFLSDLKIALLSEDDSMDLIEKIGDALKILRGEPKDGNADIMEKNKDVVSSENVLPNEEISQSNDRIVLTHELIESARTPNGGFTKSQLAAIGVPWPRPTDWIEQVIGKEITQQQLEDFRRIEYIRKPGEKIEPENKGLSYKDVAKDKEERNRMKAIMRVFRRNRRSLSTRELAYEISWDDWGGSVVRPNDVEALLHIMPEIQSTGNGKYKLREDGNNTPESIINPDCENIQEKSQASLTKSRRWRTKEDRDLVDFFEGGMTITQLAQFFDRDEEIVKERLRQKGYNIY